MSATAGILFEIFDRLKGLVQSGAQARKEEKAKLADALGDAVTVANHTLQYIAGRQHGEKRDVPREISLSEEWTRAGVKLVALPPPAQDLANRYFIKAEFWSDPSRWTDEQIEKAHIKLDEVARESREVLQTKLAGH